MFKITNKTLAAAGYLLVYPLAFLPGLWLWLGAEDRDPWLAAHGRSAAIFNVAIFIGYLALAPLVHLSALIKLLAHWGIPWAWRNTLPGGVPHNPPTSYGWMGLLYLATTICFVALWLAAFIFNIFSAWRATRGLEPWIRWPGGGRPQTEGLTNKREDMENQPQGDAISPKTGAEQTITIYKSETKNRKLFLSAAALGIYLIASILLLLAPLHFDLHQRLIANPSPNPGDPSTSLWSLIWYPWAIGHGLNPFYSHAVWAPVGANLLWSTSIPSLAFLLAPVTRWFGVMVSYNLIALLAPVTSAWMTYLVCRRLIGNFWPSLFGGWLFGFSSYEFVHLQLNMHLFVTFALPLAVWLYLRRHDGKMSRRRYIGAIALLAIFQFGVSTEILAMAAPLGLLAALLPVLLPPEESARRRYVEHFMETFGGLALAGVLLLPAFYYLFFVQYVHGRFMPTIPADLMNFLVPTQATWFGGGPRMPAVDRYLPQFLWVFERGAYLGIPLIILVLLFNREFINHRRARLLTLMMAVCWILSLGPTLLLSPTTQQTLPIALPWLLLGHLPLFDKVIPDRLVVYVTLVAAIMAGWWLAKSQVSRVWKLLLASLTILFLLPNVPAGNWSYRPDNPAFFKMNMIARYLPRGARVVILPYSHWGYSMLWQAEDHFYFAMAGGYVGLYLPPPYACSKVVHVFLHEATVSPRQFAPALRKFIQTFKVQAIIVAGNDKATYASLIAPLQIKPIHTGGVWLYLLNHTRPNE